jgi:hypothetical protein
MIETFTHATFAPLVDSSFAVGPPAAQTDEGALELVLVEAKQLRSATAFSLKFRGAREPILAQGSYRFAHGQLGAFELFICPIGRDHAGMYYEAVFNRLPPGMRLDPP